jgi:large subunit ribosomal protein L15
MKLNSLSPAEGSVKNNFRRGRGQGSGGGGTATQGHKGAQSRSGNKKKRGFEGGQMPLQRRVPKFGFKNINRIDHKGVNLDIIQKIVDTKNITEITKEVLIANGVASKNDLIKILVNILVHAFTATAKAAIESKGGVATEI